MSESLLHDLLGITHLPVGLINGRVTPTTAEALTAMAVATPTLTPAAGTTAGHHWLRNTILLAIGTAAVCSATLVAVHLSAPDPMMYVKICPIIGSDGLPSPYAQAIVSNQSAAIANCAAGAGR